MHQPEERAGTLDHGERPADQKNQPDHRRRIDDSLGDGHEGLERTNRVLLHALIGARHDNAAPGCLVFPALVLACGQHPGQGRREQYAADQEGEGMGEAGMTEVSGDGDGRLSASRLSRLPP